MEAMACAYRGFVVAAAIVFASGPAVSAAEDDPVPLETLLAAPLYSSVSSAPAADRFAWVENRRGVRNVWVASGERLDPVPVTRFDKDDGQEIRDLSFSRDGKTLAFVRGGPPSFDGVSPDPASTPLGANVEIWIWREGGDAVRFGEGAAPDLSRDGASLAFVRGGKIFLGSTLQPEKAGAVVQVRGKPKTLRWSPDGARLAFVSDRGDHAFVGVYSLQAKSVVWMEPGFTSDGSPVWSPDGSRVAFLRMPPDPVRPSLAATFETSGPFEIWVADSGTGKGRAAFRSGDRTAGNAQESEESPLQWAAGDVLVFPWERDGWVRLYAVPAAGGGAVALSPAGCEARTPRLSADRAQAVFVANCGDPDRSHLWTVPLRGGETRIRTPGTGIETTPAVAARRAVFLAGSGRRPAVPSVVDLDAGTGARPLVPAALDGFPVERLADPEPIVLRAADGVGFHAQLFRRAGLAGRRPAVIYVHGGPQRQMLLGWHPMDYYHHAYSMIQHLASKGLVVLSVNFRGGTGYGRAFRIPPRFGPEGASELQDVVAAARWLRKRADVDPARIAIWGGSFGGYLTAMALARAPDLFAAGVDVHGVHDYRAFLGHWGVATTELSRKELDLALASSPVADLTRWRAPVLLVHGDHDRNVRFSHSLDLFQRLQALPHPPEVETLMLPDEVHLILRHASWVALLGGASEFLERRLGGG